MFGAHLPRSPSIVNCGDTIPARSPAVCGQTPPVESRGFPALVFVWRRWTSSRCRVAFIQSRFIVRVWQLPSVWGGEIKNPASDSGAGLEKNFRFSSRCHLPARSLSTFDSGVRPGCGMDRPRSNRQPRLVRPGRLACATVRSGQFVAVMLMQVFIDGRSCIPGGRAPTTYTLRGRVILNSNIRIRECTGGAPTASAVLRGTSVGRGSKFKAQSSKFKRSSKGQVPKVPRRRSSWGY